MAGHQDMGATDRRSAAILGTRLLAVARLIRIEYCALGAAGVLAGAFLTTGRLPSTPAISQPLPCSSSRPAVIHSTTCQTWTVTG